MKYIDTEKLLAEIERRKADAKLYDMSGGDAPIYDELLSIIASLQQEQPEVDLEKEVDKFLSETGAPYFWCDDDEQKEWCDIIARHFAEWGAIHLNTTKEE